MYEAELMYSLDGKHALGNIKSRNIFRKRVVLDEHGHQVASGQELHYEVKIC